MRGIRAVAVEGHKSSIVSHIKSNRYAQTSLPAFHSLDSVSSVSGDIRLLFVAYMRL